MVEYIIDGDSEIDESQLLRGDITDDGNIKMNDALIIYDNIVEWLDKVGK